MLRTILTCNLLIKENNQSVVPNKKPVRACLNGCEGINLATTTPYPQLKITMLRPKANNNAVLTNSEGHISRNYSQNNRLVIIKKMYF
jgi:hypothetical protein